MRIALYRLKLDSTVKTQEKSDQKSVLLLLLLHVGLALLIREIRLLSTIHALLVLALGLYTALTANDLAQVVPFAAYIIGAEVLWRMTKAGIFWEYGKYAMVLLLIVALIKQRKPLKNLFLPLFSFLFLLPAIILTLNAHGFTKQTQEMISFNLSGALAIFVCVVFFSQVTIDQAGLRKTVWSAVFPIISILTLAIVSTLTATTINFGDESIFVTSGGYGPNQVSAVLGLGALLLILYAMQPKFKGRILAITLSLLLIVQSFLTFSRGGIYNLVIALGLAFLVLLRKPSKVIKPFLIVFLIVLILGFVLFPHLEDLTKGALSARFTDTDPTNRIELANKDIDLFLANPLTGVGVGMSAFMRTGMAYVAAHTEYTRILAEHGVFGIIYLGVLGFLLLRRFFQVLDTMSQAWMVASAGWAAVEMGHAAMRIAAIAFLLGFAFVTLTQESNSSPDQTQYSHTRLNKFRGPGSAKSDGNNIYW